MLGGPAHLRSVSPNLETKAFVAAMRGSRRLCQAQAAVECLHCVLQGRHHIPSLRLRNVRLYTFRGVFGMYPRKLVMVAANEKSAPNIADPDRRAPEARSYQMRRMPPAGSAGATSSPVPPRQPQWTQCHPRCGTRFIVCIVWMHTSDAGCVCAERTRRQGLDNRGSHRSPSEVVKSHVPQ